MEKAQKGRPMGVKFPERTQLYLTADDKRLLEGLAVKRQERCAAVVRALIREAAKREGIG